MSSNFANKLDLKSISFYNKANKALKIISLKPIDILLDSQVQPSSSVYPTVVVPDIAVNVLTQKNTGFKSVISTLQKSSQEYTGIVPITTQVQVLSENVTKYNIVVNVAGRKEEKVYTFNKSTNKVDMHASVVVPSVVKSVVSV